jgi:uncharacterized membrane protein YphA (DoxX/SURF4 family)
MLLAYWITASLLALVYLVSGAPKIFRSQEALLASGQGWVTDVNPALPKLVGILEVLGALGVILPPLTNIAVYLAPTAAIGLVLVQAVAIGIHLKAGETKALPINFVLLGLAAVVAGLGIASLPL